MRVMPLVIIITIIMTKIIQSPHSLPSSSPMFLRLVAVLYELLSPGRKFCTSFFQLGAALLDSCAASLQQGREQCGGAAVDLAQLLGKALKAVAEHELLGSWWSVWGKSMGRIHANTWVTYCWIIWAYGLA